MREIQRKNLILPAVRVFERKISCDLRGFNADLYDDDVYFNAGVDAQLGRQQNYSKSKKNVLRGLHGDDHTFKLISCVSGCFMLVVVNYIENSSDFGKWEKFILTEDNGLQVLIPPNYLNGHLILSEEARFFYNQSSHYTGQKNQWSVGWNDPRFNIDWPISIPILSERDKLAAEISARDFGQK